MARVDNSQAGRHGRLAGTVQCGDALRRATKKHHRPNWPQLHTPLVAAALYTYRVMHPTHLDAGQLYYSGFL